jgi:acetolactate synthase-1/3 small subunit
MEIVRVFRARVVDLAPRTLIMEITGADDKIDALVEVLRPFGILEMVRTGLVVMTRGLKVSEKEEAPAVSPAQPGSMAATESSHSV